MPGYLEQQARLGQVRVSVEKTRVDRTHMASEEPVERSDGIDRIVHPNMKTQSVALVNYLDRRSHKLRSNKNPTASIAMTVACRFPFPETADFDRENAKAASGLTLRHPSMLAPSDAWTSPPSTVIVSPTT